MNRVFRTVVAFFIVAVSARAAQAQVAVGYSASGRLVVALDGLHLSLDAYNIVTGTVADARLPVVLTGHSLVNALLGNDLDAASFKIRNLAQGTATGEALHAGYTLTCGTGLGGCGDFTAARTLRILNTTVTAGAYPVPGRIPTFTVNDQGQLEQAGSSTDGSGLTGVSAAAVSLSGQTLWASPAIGEVGRISGNNTWSKCSAAASGTVDCQGVYQGTAGSVATDGPLLLLFDSGLTLTAGDSVFVSDLTDGRVRNVAPSASGHYILRLGTLVDASGYNSVAGSAQRVVFRPGIIAGPLPL